MQEQLAIQALQSSRLVSPRHSNKRTLEAYNRNVEEFVAHTLQDINQTPEMREWIDAALNNIPSKGVVFEIGSAILRDANYMRQKGYQVICSDAAINFVLYLRELGENALYLNVLEDELPGKYDLVFANSVFPHFTPNEAHTALKTIYNGLVGGGCVALSLKQGLGEEWINEKMDDKRFTHYWKIEDVFKLLSEEGFGVIFHNSNIGPYPSHNWINFVAKKK